MGRQGPGSDTEPAAEAKHGVPDSPGAQRSPLSRPHGEGSPPTQEPVFLISLAQANLMGEQHRRTASALGDPPLGDQRQGTRKGRL